MELKQKFELKQLFAPQMQQSLKILALPLLDLRAVVEQELSDNPFLEESQPKDELAKKTASTKNLEEFVRSLPSHDKDWYLKSHLSKTGSNLDFRFQQISKKTSLQDVLLRQLGMFNNGDEELIIGQEIIGNIDENGYLKVSLEEIASTLNVGLKAAENTLNLIQKFEPAGVAARTIQECLLIQLKLAKENDPLLIKIIQEHLKDVAKKNYSRIAKALKQPAQAIEPLIKKILKLDPKPGRNYSTEEAQRIIPDIIIDEKGEDFQITINNENIPGLSINKTYRDMLKKDNIDPQAKEFLTIKLRNAIELLSAISKRQTTLRKVVETVIAFQQEAIKENLSHLKPLTFKQVAQNLNMHESTICRVVMNKYVKTPFGIVALKNFFTSHVHDTNGQAVSSNHIKGLIKEFIENEDKKRPLSDQKIAKLLKEKDLSVSRRTVAKYREELKILSSIYRKAG